MTRIFNPNAAFAALITLSSATCAEEPVNPTQPYATVKVCSIAPAPDGLHQALVAPSP